MKERKNTLNAPGLVNERIAGNSTKQIDYAIDCLFNGHIVEVKDHYELGNNRKTNSLLFRRILNRLKYEHGLDVLEKNKKIKIDGSNFTLELV